MAAEESGKLKITASLVAELVKHQFPEWANLQIVPVKLSGHDNRTFHLGKSMLVRLPSMQKYSQQVLKEQKWLPILAKHLSVSIPEPIGMGFSSEDYPWSWSVYKWIEGENSDTLQSADQSQFALDLIQFLKELHKIDPNGGPRPGAHNFYRGANLTVYDAETRSAIAKLGDSGLIDVDSVTRVWQDAINASPWFGNPVWVHGDLSAGNILVKNRKLAAVIDWGAMGVGDPACDLVIAWTFLEKESRDIFKSNLGLDSDTWLRARGWCLWKALITLVKLKDKASPEALKHLMIIKELLED